MSVSVKEVLLMNVEQLQQELKVLQLDSNGNKPELQERLIEVMIHKKHGNHEKTSQRRHSKCSVNSEGEHKQIKIDPIRLGKLLPNFNGDWEKYQAFSSKIILIMKTYDPPEEEFKIEVINKLVGKAAEWFHSRPEYITYNLTDILEVMSQMYDTRPNKVEQRKKFEQRRWKIQEEFYSYYQDKVILANHLDIEDGELIDYLIDGMSNIRLQSQARMHRFANKEDLLEAMRNVSEVERGVHQPNKVMSTMATEREKSTNNSKINNRPRRMSCYNCSEVGHISTKCTNPKRPYGSCMACGKVGHRVNECPSKNSKFHMRESSGVPDKQNTNVHYCSELERDSTKPLGNLDIGSSSLNNNTIANITSTSTQGIFLDLKLFIGNSKCFSIAAMVDTGSPISIIKSNCIPNCYMKIVDASCEYSGINQSRLNVCGKVETQILYNDILYGATLIVVSDKTMSHDMIVGRDFLEMCQTRINIGKMEVKLGSKESGEASVNDSFDREVLNISVDSERVDGLDSLNIDKSGS